MDARNDSWSVDDSVALYRVDDWADRFFHVNEAGHAAVRTARPEGESIDIHAVAEDLRARGVEFPALIRFHDVLRARVERVNLAFASAIDESGYQGSYRGVYPIKVNQLHEVVEEILDAGRPFRMGLECGSKTELVAALPHITDDEILLICNGVKDDAMLELMLAATGSRPQRDSGDGEVRRSHAVAGDGPRHGTCGHGWACAFASTPAVPASGPNPAVTCRNSAFPSPSCWNVVGMLRQRRDARLPELAPLPHR